MLNYKDNLEFNNYRYENNELKKKKTIITPIVDLKEHLIDLSIRPYIIGDTINKYYKHLNYNTLFTINFNDLNNHIDYKYNLEEYLAIFNNLNIDFDYFNSLNLNNEDTINLYKNLLLFLNNNKFLKYKEANLYYDSLNKIYHDELTTNNKDLQMKHKGLFLDISDHIDNIFSNIDRLLISDELKNNLKDKFNLSYTYKLNLVSNLGSKLQFELKEPYLISGISLILINNDLFDIINYISPNIISKLEFYFESSDLLYLDTLTYSINPLTGNKIPIFLSKEVKDIKVIYCDEVEILNKYNIKPHKIIDHNILINSDFINGLTINEANKVILDTFLEEGLIEKEIKYLYNQILLSKDIYSNLNTTIYIDNNNITINDNLSLLNNNIKIYLNNSFISLFNYIINLLYLYDIDILEDKDLNKLSILLNKAIIIYRTDNIINDLLLPIIFLSILEDVYNIKIINDFEFIEVNNSYDKYSNDFSFENKNIINYQEVSKIYSYDALRLFILNNQNHKKIYYSLDDLFKYKKLSFEIESLFNKASDFKLVLTNDIIKIRENILDNLLSYNFNEIINIIINNIELLKQKEFSKYNLSELLIILALLSPSLANKLNKNYYNNRLNLIDGELPKHL